MTDSLPQPVQVTSPPALLDKDFNPTATTATRSNENPPLNIKKETEVIRGAPTEVEKVSRIKDEVAESDPDGHILLDLPGLIEHLFPDEKFPVAWEDLKSAVMESTLWDSERNQWSDPDPTSASFFTYLSDAMQAARRRGPARPDYISHVSARRWRAECDRPPFGEARTYHRQYEVNLVINGSPCARWENVAVNVERRREASEAGHALEKLTHAAPKIFYGQPDRRFLISLSICGNSVRAYVFDRAGLVGSEPFDLWRDCDSMIRLMAGFEFADDASLGYDPSIYNDIMRPSVQILVAGGKKYEAEEIIYTSDELHGRATVVRRCLLDNVDYIIKDTWVLASTSQNEGALLHKAEGIEGISKVISNENLILPGKHTENDNDPLDDTSHLRSFIEGLRDYPFRERYKKLRVWVHNRIVTTPFAHRLECFESKEELVSVLIDAIRAHSRLVEKNILHSDVSLGNIMIHRPNSSQAKGILIDLDCAVLTHGEDNKVTKEALLAAKRNECGTIPYAPVDVLMGILPNKIRQAHHDLESFLYVLLWLAMYFSGPKGLQRTDIDLKKEPHFQLWTWGGKLARTTEQIGEAKYMVMSTTPEHFRRIITSKCTPYFQDLVPCIEELRLRFFPDLRGASRPRVTHGEVIDILQKHLRVLKDNARDRTNAVEKKEDVAAGKRKRSDDDEEEGRRDEDDFRISKRAKVERKEIIRC